MRDGGKRTRGSLNVLASPGRPLGLAGASYPRLSLLSTLSGFFPCEGRRGRQQVLLEAAMSAVSSAPAITALYGGADSRGALDCCPEAQTKRRTRG